MGTAGFFEQPGDKKFSFPKYRSANRANPAAISLQTIDTA
jgi:hypothetical protein